jgi:two-component system, LuxR family, sensor kinase FixL
MERYSREELELRYYSVIDSAVDGIITIDSVGVMETVNKSVLQLFGYTQNELIGKNVSMLMPEPHRSMHDKYLQEYLKTGHAKIIGIGRSLHAQKKNGDLFPILLSVSEMRLGDRIVFTGFINDISELVMAKESLALLNQELEGKVNDRTEELATTVNQLLSTNRKLADEILERQIIERALEEKHNQLQIALQRERELGELKTRFVSMASHEFRTPLTTILSSTSLAQRYSDINQPDKLNQHLEKVKASVAHLTSILNDFLNLTKLEEGQIRLMIETFDIGSFCREVIEELAGLTKPEQHIICEGHHEGVFLNTDKKVLRNILYNLLSNALKYSDKDVFVKLDLTSATVFQIAVRDQGIGIPLEDQKHLFERFFRANNAMNISGTGLGLNIVKRYLDLLGGTIDFISAPEVGTTFTVLIPLIIKTEIDE